MNNQSTIRKMASAKVLQWGKEAAIAAARAIQMGRDAFEVKYPSGLTVMRFAQPFSDFGMHFEVPVDVWNKIKSNGGKVEQ